MIKTDSSSVVSQLRGRGSMIERVIHCSLFSSGNKFDVLWLGAKIQALGSFQQLFVVCRHSLHKTYCPLSKLFHTSLQCFYLIFGIHVFCLFFTIFQCQYLSFDRLSQDYNLSCYPCTGSIRSRSSLWIVCNSCVITITISNILLFV